MRKYLLLAFCFFISHLLYAQPSITPEQVKDYIGQTVTVCGKVYGGKFLDAANNKPTFLNMGAAYPKQLLTIVIWGNTRNLFSYKPEEYLKNKSVCITGKVEVFKNQPQIVLYDTAQLKIH